jgi:agmatinase
VTIQPQSGTGAGSRPRYGPANSLETPRFSGIRTFARLPAVSDDLDGVDVAIVGIPFDTGGTYRVGARFGPEAIRSSSVLLRPYSDAMGIGAFDYLSVIDYGDLAVLPGYIEQSYERIRAGLLPLVRAGVVPIGLGGDHSITLAELRAIAEVHGPLGLIQLDSHSDTVESYFGMPHTHGTPFWHGVKEGLLDTRRVVQVGLRGSIYAARDYEVPRELGFEVITAAEAHSTDMRALAERIRDRVAGGPVFLSYDIDFLDPAYAPATGTPEIGGFTTWDFQNVVRRLTGLNFVGFDVVEVIPEYDVAATTSLAAANGTYEFLTLLACARRDSRAT